MKTRVVFYFLLAFFISVNVKAQVPKQQASYQKKVLAIPTRWMAIVSPKNALPEYPRPQMARSKWENLNGLWDYAITGKNQPAPTKFEGSILVPYPIESALSGVKKSLQPDQALWYRKNLVISGLKNAERLLLNFGAVSWEATVYVNGKEAGNHKGAYTAFTIDITEAVKMGSNELLVKITNPLEKGIGPRGKQTLNPSGMWYTPSSGIWQTVWLEKVPENYIKSIKVTPDVDKGELTLSVFPSLPVKGISPGGREEYSVEAIAYDGKKAVSTLSVVPTSLPGGERSSMVLKVPNAKLWSPDSPFLYDLVIKLKKNGKVVDEVKSYFGMRKVEIKKDDKGIDRIFLNNKYTYNLGTLDQGFWPDGLYTAPTDEALKFDIEAIKAMGFNSIRKHIKVEPARWYYHADKLGVLVWQDLVQPGGKLERGGLILPEVKHQFEKESKEVLEQLNHFPSIITWGLFNERWGEYDQERLEKWVKDTDPTRLVNGHSGAAIVNGKMEKRNIEEVVSRSINSDMADVHSYPPPAIPNHIPGKAMVLGEFGGIGVQVNGHLWDDLQSVYAYGKTVSAGEMRSTYSSMVDSLIKFEKQGLSASIYTQPYDVEGEQNGIMTYDREVTKVPFEVMRGINAKLWPVSSKITPKIANADTAGIDFDKEIASYREGKRDSAFLRSLAILAQAKKNAEWSRILSAEYIKQLKNPFTEVNLKFIRRFTRNTSDPGFDIFYKNMNKVNAVLGADAAERVVTSAIERTEITPVTKAGKPDWKGIENNISSKYGDIGRESVWQSKLLYSYNEKQWRDFEEILIPWFETYGHKRSWVDPGRFINNMAWGAFENINDRKKLESVLKMTVHGLEMTPEDEMLIDTHANLLYKLGRKDEAIEWEEKAIALNPNEAGYRETLEKMKANKITWPAPENVK